MKFVHFKQVTAAALAIIALAACSPGSDTIELAGGSKGKPSATSEPTASSTSVPTVYASPSASPTSVPAAGGMTVGPNGVSMPGLTVNRDGVRMPGLTVAPTGSVIDSGAAGRLSKPVVTQMPQVTSAVAAYNDKLKAALQTMVTSYCGVPIELAPATMQLSIYQDVQKQYQAVVVQMKGATAPSFEEAVKKACSSKLPK